MSATVPELIEGYSQGLYATWVWYRPYRVLFDCGEGVALRLQNSVTAIRHVFLSHGHLDHISGLPSLLNIRNHGMGDPEAPLTILHPEGDGLVKMMRDYLERSHRGLKFDLTWQAVRAGERVPIDRTRSVEAFASAHTPGALSLGYRIREHRTRLRPELRGLSEEAVRELARRSGREAVAETYEQTLLLYGGDGLAPGAEWLDGAELACLEATFLDSAERNQMNHATVGEAVAAAAGAGVQTLVLNHFSGRYHYRDIRRAVRAAVDQAKYEGGVYLLWRDELRPL